MNNDQKESLDVTNQPSNNDTIAIIVGIVVLSLCSSLICSFFTCLRRLRRTGVSELQKEQGGDIILQMVYFDENSLSDPPSPVPKVLMLHRGVPQLTDCGSTDEEEPYSPVDNKEYDLVDTAPALSDYEDGNSHIQSMLKNLSELPTHVYRSMIADDVTSSSTVTSQEEIGSENAVVCTFDELQHVMKYLKSEASSISRSSISLFSVEAYSPMNREEKLKYEESDTSHAFSQSVLTVRSVARRSLNLNSKCNQPNISKSKSIHSDSIYPIVKLRDDVYTEEEQDDNSSLRQSLGDVEVSKESLVISNLEQTVPHLGHPEFLNVRIQSPNLNRQIVRVESKSNTSDKYFIIRAAKKDQELSDSALYSSTW